MAYFVTIDLHGQTVESARKILNEKLKALPADTHEVTVIHGYHGGTAILQMVRSYKNSKIERKILGLNNGETVLVIKQNK